MNTIPISEKCVIIQGMVERKPKLLVVDDEVDQRLSTQSYFSKRNFLVLTAASGEDAVVQLKKDKPDIVILDMKLSGEMTGKDVLRSLRAFDKKTEIIIITGSLLPEREIRELTRLGIAGLLIKPVELSALDKIIKEILTRNYPQAVRFEGIKTKEPADLSLRRVSHELINIINNIVSKCELYILDTEEGLDKGKSEKERLEEAISTLRLVLKQSERLTDLAKKLAALAKKE